MIYLAMKPNWPRNPDKKMSAHICVRCLFYPYTVQTYLCIFPFQMAKIGNYPSVTKSIVL